MASDSDDPRSIRSVAVTAEDAVAAYEASERNARETVLRITPPFSGRMRARLHMPGDDPGSDPSTIHLDPADLFDDSRLPAYPEPAETEREIRDDPDSTYSTELHHDRHVEAVQQWRERAREAITDEIGIETGPPEGPHRVEVTVLGG